MNESRQARHFLPIPPLPGLLTPYFSRLTAGEIAHCGGEPSSMYAQSPMLPFAYRWLSVPIPELHTGRWAPSLGGWQAPSVSNLESYYVMIPMELRDNLLSRAHWVSRSRWSWAALATVTVVTGAVALYYSVPWEEVEAEMAHFLVSPMHAENDVSMHSLTEDEELDDDEHVEDELLERFGGADFWRSDNTVMLISSDPSSSLCHQPLQLNLLRKREVPTAETCAEHHQEPYHLVFPEPSIPADTPTPPTDDSDAPSTPGLLSPHMQPTKRGFDSRTPSPPIIGEHEQGLFPSPILKRQMQSFRSAALCDPKALEQLPRSRRNRLKPVRRSGLATPTRSSIGLVPGVDYMPELNIEDVAENTAQQSKKIMFSEPDWSPFADIDRRGRRRSANAVMPSIPSLEKAPSPSRSQDDLELWANTTRETMAEPVT